MKLLDPFAGYRLASGHAFFHISLFAISWLVVGSLGEDSFTSCAEIVYVFKMLQWGHFLLFTFATIEYICERPSKIPEEQNDEDDKKLALVKVINRDGTQNLTARIFSSISMFIYQGIVL